MIKLILGLIAMYSMWVQALPLPGESGAIDDIRYCGGELQRTTSGKIKRSQTELRKFVEVFPCPATLLNTTSCSGWEIDHIIPLASGGCDKTVNMQWLPDAIKICAGKSCKDRWERKYHAIPREKVEAP